MSKAEKEFVKGLRDLADWIETHPGFVHPPYQGDWHLLRYCNSRKDLVEAVRTLGGKGTKGIAGEYYRVERFFGPLSIECYVNREQVCRKIVRDVEHIPAEVIPEHVIEARTKEIVEWVCDEPLLKEV